MGTGGEPNGDTVTSGGISTTGGKMVTGGVVFGGATEATGSTTAGIGTGGFAMGGIPTGGSSSPPKADFRFLINGVQWADTAGNPIQAHGGGMLFADGNYYWFGENRNPNGTFFAVSAYRSTDLVHWEFVNHILRNTSGPGLDPANIERPKVVYNASTKKYVLWMHWENGTNYGEARAAVASSDEVTGAYTYHGSFRPLVDTGVIDHGKPGYMSRDFCLYVDDDGAGYLISASNENYDLNLYRMTTDYFGIEKLVAVLFKGGHREAPVMWKRAGVYFLLTSGATGWSPNQALYATSKSLDSGWSALAKVGDATTFHSQSTFILSIQGTAGTDYMYMGDRWAGAWKGKVNDSTYVWLPLTFPTTTTLAMSWNTTLSFDTLLGTVVGKNHSFRLINQKSGMALDVSTGTTGSSHRIVQHHAGETSTQVWSLAYNGAGFFRLQNETTRKVLDVLDESVADGAPLGLWDDLGGDNQLWSVVDLGNGRYKMKNKSSGKFVAVAQGSLQADAAILQRSGSTGEEQQWQFVPSN
jgi:hypothetical protein